jgi:2-oxoglutarate ferredoxin oxidoreductase subunit alpha
VEDLEAVFIGWGSTYGIIKEATEKLVKEGHKIGYLHFSDIYPLPQKFLDILKIKSSILLKKTRRDNLQL